MPVLGLDELVVVSWLLHPKRRDLLGLGHLGVWMQWFSLKSLVELARVFGIKLPLSYCREVAITLLVLGVLSRKLLVWAKILPSLVLVVVLLRRQVLEVVRTFEYVGAHLGPS